MFVLKSLLEYVLEIFILYNTTKFPTVSNLNYEYIILITVITVFLSFMTFGSFSSFFTFIYKGLKLSIYRLYFNIFKCSLTLTFPTLTAMSVLAEKNPVDVYSLIKAKRQLWCWRAQRFLFILSYMTLCVSYITISTLSFTKFSRYYMCSYQHQQCFIGLYLIGSWRFKQFFSSKNSDQTTRNSSSALLEILTFKSSYFIFIFSVSALFKSSQNPWIFIFFLIPKNNLHFASYIT